MKKIGFLFLIFIILAIGFSFITNPPLFFSNIINTLELWLYKVYPSIFTFYLLSSLLINTKLLNKLIYHLRFIFKFLKFKNENALQIFLLSIFVGNPTSASLICEALNNGSIDYQEAKKLLKCSSFINPFFIISFLLLFSLKYAMLVLLVHILSNIIIALFQNAKEEKTIINNFQLSFSLNNFLKSINNVIYLLLMISGIMVFTNLLKYSLEYVFSSFFAYPLFLRIILTNMEISLGLADIINLNFKLFPTLLLSSFICSFSGISIHLQVLNIIKEEKLPYWDFFRYRVLQAVLSVLLCSIFYYII